MGTCLIRVQHRDKSTGKAPGNIHYYCLHLGETEAEGCLALAPVPGSLSFSVISAQQASLW